MHSKHAEPPIICAVSKLKARMAEMLAEFEAPDTASVFTTDEQARVSDEYFLSSGVCRTCG
jgi:hypothetical protein